MQLSAELGLHRYLLPFDLRQVPVYRFCLVIVRSRVGGSAAALAATRAGASVAVIAKTDLSEGSTRYAQGGMAAVLDSADSFESHIQDTVEVGRGLSEQAVVEMVVRGGPKAVDACTRARER